MRPLAGSGQWLLALRLWLFFLVRQIALSATARFLPSRAAAFPSPSPLGTELAVLLFWSLAGVCVCV